MTEDREVIHRDDVAKCPFCDMPVTIIASRSTGLVVFSCPPESPCAGSGLGTYADLRKLDKAVETWNRRASA